MRDPARIKKLLTEIEKYWSNNPDLRLCQLLENLLPTEVKCTHCNGVGSIPESVGVLERNWRQCLRCQGNGFIYISNYSIEDDVLIRKLETLNGLQVCTPKVDY